MTTRSILLFILNLFSTFVGVVIGARILLLMFGANQAVPIVAWINRASDVFIYPFSGLFQSVLVSGRSVIDLNAIIALIAYAIVFALLYRLVFFLTRTTVETDMGPMHSHI